MKRIFLTKAFFISVILIYSVLFLFCTIDLTKCFNNKNSNPYMTIMYTDKNNITQYVMYDLNTQKENIVYSYKNTGFPDGVIAENKKQLYYSLKTSDLYSHLFKVDFANKEKLGKQIMIPNINIDKFSISKNKIIMRIVQSEHKNFQIATYDLVNEKVNIWNTEETDLSILDFDYNKYTHKVYAIERSMNEFLKTNLPEIPNHKIIEFDENGNRLNEVFKINVFIDSISVSKDGSLALVSGSTDTPTPYIYMIDLKNSKVKTMLKSENGYIVKHPIFAPDEKGFYFLAITPESKTFITNLGESAQTRGIYYFNFSSQKITKIFMKDDGIVRNFNISHD